MSGSKMNGSYDGMSRDELILQNAELKKRIASLERRLQRCKRGLLVTGKKASGHPLFDSSVHSSSLFEKSSYTVYLIKNISESTFFKLYKKLLGIIRKYSFVRTTLYIMTLVIGFLSSSAVFLLAGSFFLVSLPFALFFGYLIFLVAFLERKKTSKAFLASLGGKKIYLCFPPSDKALIRNSFLLSQAHEWASDGEGTVIIVLRALSHKKYGFQYKRLFLSCLEAEKNIFLVRPHFYFSIKRILEKKYSENITVIY